MTKRTTVMTLAILAVFVLSGSVFAADLVGSKWDLSYTEAKDENGKVTKMVPADMGMKVGDIFLEFKADGKAVSPISPDLTYTVQGNAVMITDDGETTTGKVDGDTLIFEDDAQKMVYLKVK
jgi:hypothetical protein